MMSGVIPGKSTFYQKKRIVGQSIFFILKEEQRTKSHGAWQTSIYLFNQLRLKNYKSHSIKT